MTGPAETGRLDIAPMPEVPAEPPSDWRRVDVRTILVKPFNEILGLIPVLVGVVVLGQHGGDQIWWGLGVIALLICRGVLHWVTTRYRVTEEQVELRTGLFFRQKVSTRRDRVRTVESTAKLGHRLFGVTAVRVGTGQNEQRHVKPLLLDSVTGAEADRLRRELLRRTAPVTVAEAEPAGSQLIGRLEPAWLRYAPLTLSGLASIGVLVSLIWRSANELNVNLATFGPLREALRWAEHTSTGLVIATGVLAVLVIILVGSFVVYVFQFAGYTLTREPDDTLHVRRGLLTRSAVTIEEARLRGVEIRQPLLLRAGGGARCGAIATGLRHRSESHLLMPPGPAAEAHRIADAALDTGESPTLTTLVRHPRRALVRRMNRALLPALCVPLLLWLGTLPGWLPSWPWHIALVLPVVGALLAVDRYRNLGHALTKHYLVARSGSMDRRTVALQRTGIIGWRVHRSLFQRRAGLVTLAATTAAGKGVYHVLDVAESAGLALAEEATPGMLAAFLERA